MGIDLKWLVCGSASRDHNYSPTMIDVGRDYDYHKKLRDVTDYDPPTYVGCYLAQSDDGEPTYGDLPKTDPYGDKYRMMKAGDIAAIDHHGKWDTKAAIAYVRALHPDTWIILHWH